MEELQMVNLENTDIINWDFSLLKSQLQQKLSYYEAIVYTDDNIKLAKEDRTALNKAKKIIDDARKAYKAKCLEPYEALESQIKELVNMIESQRSLIDDTVKEFEERQKVKKEVEIKAYYDKKSFVLGEYAEQLYSKLLDPKWMNLSTSKTKYEEGIQLAVNSAFTDISTIKEMESPFVNTLIEIYLSSLSMEQVNEKNEELKIAQEKAGLSSGAATGKTPPIQALNNQLTEKTEYGEDGIVIRVQGTQNQLNQITDFMKAIGVTYQIQ